MPLKNVLNRSWPKNYLSFGVLAKPGLALIILLAMATGCSSPKIVMGTPTPPSFRLTILHNNDGQSQLVNLGSGLEDFGGVARFAAAVKRERQASSFSHAGESGAIMVSSGDNILPGPEFNAGLQTGTFFDALALDLIGYDAIVLGNHEFYFGPDVLAEFIQQVAESKATFISANLDFSDEPVLKALNKTGRLAESVAVEKNGAMIGIIGLTTPNLRAISSPRKVHIIQDIAREVQLEVALLEYRGVNKILLISHLQDLDADIGLVGRITGVDVVVAGGGNELLANEDDPLIPGSKQPDGPYPFIATDLEGKSVPLVTTPGQYGYLGKLVVQFDGEGNVTVDGEASGPIRIAGGDHSDAVQPDPQVQQMVVDPVVELLEPTPPPPPIAISQVTLNGRSKEVRSRETNQGNLIADALLWEARIRADDYGATPPDVALQNGGGIRIGLPAGPILQIDTFKTAPFPNLVAILENISRAQFKEILENAVSRAVEGDPVGGTGRFAQVSGFRFEWSESGTAQVLGPNGEPDIPGTRVKRVILDDGTTIVDNGKVPPGPALAVTVIDFLAKGGDQYPFRGAPFTNVGVSYQRALANYLQEPSGLNGTVTAADYPPGGEGRIRRLP